MSLDLGAQVFFLLLSTAGWFAFGLNKKRAEMQRRQDFAKFRELQSQSHEEQTEELSSLQAQMRGIIENMQLQTEHIIESSIVDGFRQGFKAAEAEPGMPVEIAVLLLRANIAEFEEAQSRGAFWTQPDKPEIV